MFFIGIFFGLCTALFQDLGYIFSGKFVLSGGKPGELLTHSQLLMGGVSLLFLPVLFLFGHPQSMNFLIPMLCVCVGSGGGQYFFFKAEKHLESAAVSSLMGLRVVILAAAMYFLHGETYNIMQCAGIFLAALSAFVLNWENGKLKLNGMGSFSLSLGFYCLSDLSVGNMVKGFGLDSLTAASLFSVALVNIFTGLVMLPFLTTGTTEKPFRKTFAFAGAWFLKQFCLYFCYALIGPVHGNVVLSIRGPLAMVLEALRGRRKKTSTDSTDRKRKIRKITAVLMMTTAIVLYSLWS